MGKHRRRSNHSYQFVSGALAALVVFGIILMLSDCGGVTSSKSGSSTSGNPSGSPSGNPSGSPSGNPSGNQSGAMAVTTYHYDTLRTGANRNETILTLANVNASSFGKVASFDVDGEIYGQPLYLQSVSIGGTAHNVVFVATEHDSVYAFDADAKTTSPLWQKNFLNPGAGITTVDSATDFPTPYEDIAPEVGITSTPVIDSTSGTIYVVAKTKENGEFFQRLHALDIRSGAEKFGGPTTIQASIPGAGTVNDGNGNIVFDPLICLQRSALLLLSGKIYIAFASHGDFDPFLGWLLVYDAQTLKQVAAFAPSADGSGGGIWESGNGPAADASGHVFVGIGNGDYTADINGRDYGDSFLKLALSGDTLNVLDWFTPFNFRELNDLDHDLGSGGPILLPDQPSGPTHLLMGGDKAGDFFVINRDAMGHNHASDNSQAVQQIDLGSGLFTNPTAWKDNVYIGPAGAPLQCYKISNGQLTLSSQGSATSGFPGISTAVSSNGDSNGIAWALQVDQWDNGPATLRAYDANDCTHELYNSDQASGGRDTAGTAVKFTVPTVINGKVYVSGGSTLTVYGLLSH
ncbi:MAG: pyrrolo-quinoline quinone [Terriglobales bacterium]